MNLTTDVLTTSLEIRKLLTSLSGADRALAMSLAMRGISNTSAVPGGVHVSPAEKRVLSIIASHAPVSAGQILRASRDEGSPMPHGTVYSTVFSLKSKGLIVASKEAGMPLTYSLVGK